MIPILLSKENKMGMVGVVGLEPTAFRYTAIALPAELHPRLNHFTQYMIRIFYRLCR